MMEIAISASIGSQIPLIRFSTDSNSFPIDRQLAALKLQARFMWLKSGKKLITPTSSSKSLQQAYEKLVQPKEAKNTGFSIKNKNSELNHLPQIGTKPKKWIMNRNIDINILSQIRLAKGCYFFLATAGMKVWQSCIWRQ